MKFFSCEVVNVDVKHFNPKFNSTKYSRLNTKYVAQQKKLFGLPPSFIQLNPLEFALPL